jgi:hypothetical protein
MSETRSSSPEYLEVVIISEKMARHALNCTESDSPSMAMLAILVTAAIVFCVNTPTAWSIT